VKRLVKLVLSVGIMALGLWGCAAHQVLRPQLNVPLTASDVLDPYLMRWEGWRSASSDLKLRVAVGDTNFSARGHLMYLAGERYEIGFVKPFNRFLGTFYVTPSEVIYWDVHAYPKTYSLKDTVRLGDLIPIGVPNWDPRDILPFPMSGRSGGFQPDSFRTTKGGAEVIGSGDDVAYRFSFSGSQHFLSEEVIQRTGRDPVYKKYEKIRELKGWPVATRVTVTDRSGQVSFRWSLSKVALDGAEYESLMQQLHQSKSEGRP
jgi:hypothetical protein